MVIDISLIKDFNSIKLNELMAYKENILLVGENPRLEQALKILGLDKVLRHEKDPERVKAILTEP